MIIAEVAIRPKYIVIKVGEMILESRVGQES
jgi:hypothetical protein